MRSGDLAGLYSARNGTVTQLLQVTGSEGQVGILNGGTLLNSASGSMEWSAPSTVGWGGTLRNTGELTFSGTAVSLRAVEDEAGFVANNVGPWPAIVNEEGAQLVVEGGSGVALEWLLWNEGGSVVVRGWAHPKSCCCGRRSGVAVEGNGWTFSVISQCSVGTGSQLGQQTGERASTPLTAWLPSC